MSAVRPGLWRPANNLLQTRCLHCIPTATPPICNYTGRTVSRKQELETLKILQLIQKRHASSSNGKHATEQKPPMPSRKLILRALRQGLTLRPLFSAFRGQNLRNLFRQSPEEVVIAFILLAATAGCCVYVVLAYFNYFQSEQFTRYPPEIAKSLRRAIYYTTYGPDPQLALKYYTLALQQCRQHGLDPFSDEVLGLRIQLAAWLEGLGQFPKSIEVLEGLLEDCKKWVMVMEKSVKDGKVDSSGRLVGEAAKQSDNLNLADAPVQTKTSSPPQVPAEAPVPTENLFAKRTRVLGRSVGISVKLGELYADEHVLQGDAAGEHLVWAVETILKELQRRQVEGVKESEGDWMSPEQIGGALEALGNHYEAKSQHYLAAPLYLQAVSLSPPGTCHTAVLMNNLATSLAQQPVQSPFMPDPGKAAGQHTQATPQAPSRAMLLASARQWALQAQATAEKVTGEGRTEECDEACAVAMCNLGDIAAMADDMVTAKQKFKECLELSKKIEFKAGIKQAQDGLKRLSAAAPAAK
ncbi:TPR domain-containing protein [Xylariaceae sp. FL0255]|nr:TPR domain-containing protein [Xylariaceae sp. FL0255]